MLMVHFELLLVCTYVDDCLDALSADNRCQSASRFPFHDTDNAIASGHWCAEHPVVSWQSHSQRGQVPFHDTYSCSGQRVLRCRSLRCQLTIAIAGQDEFHLTLPIIHLPESTEPKIGQQPGFHFTIPIMGSPATTEVQITPLSADNRCQPVA